MTDTRRWLDTHRVTLLRRLGVTAALIAAGLVALALASGVWLGRLGLYQRMPELVLVGWALAAGALALGVVRAVRGAHRAAPDVVAREIEEAGGLRRGTLRAFADERGAVGSGALAAVADRRAAAWLETHGAAAFAPIRRRHRRAVRRGVLVAALGLGFFGASDPARRHAGFWTPLDAITRARGPVALAVDRTLVRRGDSVTVTITALGRRGAVLFVRAPGERWREQVVALDTGGRGTVVLGPLDSDRYVRAVSGSRASDTLRVRVAVPAFLTDLTLLARYPAYLELADEPLVPGGDTLVLPAGTTVLTRGRTTVPLAAAGWVTGPRRVGLGIDGSVFSGALPVTRSGRWVLALEPLGEAALEGEPPELVVKAVPDAAPRLGVPVPGADTIAPVSLRQPLVVDVADDYRVVRVEVESRRVSRLGVARPPITEAIPLPEGGVEQAVLQWLLDLNERGFLPGDTAFFRVRAWDNAPVPHRVESREFRLRLPSMAELRAAARAEAEGLTAAADSLAGRQGELVRATEELVRERQREAARAGDRAPGEALDFRATERTRELTDEQTAVVREAEELRQRVEQLAEAAWEAGLTDPAWHRQLEELQRLLERALTPELREAIEQLTQAMERLDPAAMDDALRRLADAQQRLREELERSRTLFERAALEGEMTTVADDAEELAARQEEWNRAAEAAVDSALAERERRLAAEADSLAAALAALEESAGEMEGTPEGLPAPEAADAAAAAMRQAAEAAAAGDRARAGSEGRRATGHLGPIAEQLRRQRDAMREAWRADVLATMDHALVETAQLAGQQEGILRRLERGEGGTDLRAQQAAVRDGVDRVIERLRNAAGQNALVSPRLTTALGLTRLKMMGTVEMLQRANPNMRGAQSAAGEALDGLNTVAWQLLRSRSDVAAAQSGSGFQEAVERMAQLAQQQSGLANQAGGLLPLMQQGGQMVLQELRMLAARQRALSQELERLRGEGVGGAEELAEEARDLAGELERGVLDRSIVERQERLFRRLLDQGRTLRGSEEDETERQSRSARPDNVRLPDAAARRADGPRYRYPTWEELQRLSPEERRLILDYFRRLNERRGGRE